MIEYFVKLLKILFHLNIQLRNLEYSLRSAPRAELSCKALLKDDILITASFSIMNVHSVRSF